MAIWPILQLGASYIKSLLYLEQFETPKEVVHDGRDVKAESDASQEALR